MSEEIPHGKVVAMRASHSSLRRLVTPILTSLLVGLGVTATASPAAAVGIGAQDPYMFAYTQQSLDGNSIVVEDGESMEIASEQGFDETYTGFPLKKDSVFTRNAFTRTIPTGLTVDYNTDRRWGGWGTDDCEGIWKYGASYTVKKADNCVNFFYVVDGVEVTNDSGGDLTVSTNSNSRVLRLDGVNQSNKTGHYRKLEGYARVRDVESLTVGANEISLGMSFNVCIDESLVEVDDVLTIDVEVTKNGTPMSDADWGIWGDSDADGSDTTYTVFGAEPLEDLESYSDVYLDDTTPGTYAGTLDITKSGSSVLEECPNTDTPGYPTVNSTEGGEPNLSIATHNLPTDITLTNDNWGQYGSASDGVDGAFYWMHPGTTWADPADDFATIDIVRMGVGGASEDFNGSGKLSLTTGENGYFDIARYGANNARWMTLVETASGAFQLRTGNMANADGQTDNTYTKKNLAKLCPANYKVTYLWPIGAPTTAPLGYLRCNLGSLNSASVISMGSATPTLVTSVGTAPSSSRPCVVSDWGVDTRASGASTAAVVLYTRTSSRDQNGFCGTVGATVSKRTITTVTVGGTASTKTISGNPWVTVGEPIYLNLAVGQSAGSWVGIGFDQYDTSDPQNPTYPEVAFRMSSTAVSGVTEITLDDSTDMGDWPSFVPIAETSANSLSVASWGTEWFDGEPIAHVTVGKLNLNTGVMDNGDVLDLTGFGFEAGRIGGIPIGNSSGDFSVLYLISDSQYKSMSWE